MNVREQLATRDAYARTIEARVDASPTGRPDRSSSSTDRVLPGRRRPAGGPGRLLRRHRWADLDGPRGAQGRRRHRPRARPADGGRPTSGIVVTIDLDWARRYALMRTHTALHALCGVVWRDYGAQVTGGNMEPGAGRMDFEFERM